jgi:hypothetical protein
MSEEMEWLVSSIGLLAECPGIDKSPGWRSFSREYDEPENRDYRLKSWMESRPGYSLSLRLIDMRELALHVVNEQIENDTSRSKLEASEKLARIILELLSKNGVDELASLAKEAMEMHRPIREERNVADVVWSLVRFCSRTGNLPKKKELNIEANRIDVLIRKKLKLETIPLEKEMFFGKIYENRHRVYSFIEDEEFAVIHFCPKNQWEIERWEKSDYSKILKKAGLKELPQR